jgi:NAD(P)-dependent dehydrogenase (short-subunit alcohol dehydrogenase family)
MFSEGRQRQPLGNKVAIVTGAGSAGEGIGNGCAISVLLAEHGASVLCVDLNLDFAQTTVKMIETEGKGRAKAFAGNVTKEDDCRRIVEAALEYFGRLDILINNFGVAGTKGTAVELDLEAWSAGMDINVRSMVAVTKFAVPAMKRNKSERNESPSHVCGSIVNVSSVAGLRGGNPHLLYPTSKGAIINMTRAMAAHHGAEGIRVNCICPG